MEERNLELDDDGKVKLRKRTEEDLAKEAPEAEEEIVLDIPDFEGFQEEEAAEEEKAVQALHAREAEQEKKKERAARLLGEADKLFEEGDVYAAGEKYLDSAAQNRADWRAWFGVVRVQTKDFTDFSEIYDCEAAYDAAFRRMGKQERAALAERYVPSLQAHAEKLRAESEELFREDARLREERAPAAKKAFSAAVKWFAVSAAALLAFLVAAIVLWCSISAVWDGNYLIGAAVCTGAAVLAVIPAALTARRLAQAGAQRRMCARPGSTEAGKRAEALSEEEELVRSVIEDFCR